MGDPTKVVDLKLANFQPPANPNVIQVRFVNAALEVTSVSDGSTFIVRQTHPQQRRLEGNIISMPNNIVRWQVQGFEEGPRIDALPVGDYEITLVGDGPPAIIASPQGPRLDGNVVIPPLPATPKLPSGDNIEGGNFVFSLTIRP